MFHWDATEARKISCQRSIHFTYLKPGSNRVCAVSLPLISIHDYLVVWVFSGSHLTWLILVRTAIWFHSTNGMGQKDATKFCSVLYDFRNSLVTKGGLISSQSGHGNHSCTNTIGQSQSHGWESCPGSHHISLLFFVEFRRNPQIVLLVFISPSGVVSICIYISFWLTAENYQFYVYLYVCAKISFVT